MNMYSFSRYNTTITEGDDTIIFNSLTNAVCVFSKDEYFFLKQVVDDSDTPLPKNLESDFVDRCLLNNILVPSAVDERVRLKTKVEEIKKGQSSLTLTILPTLSCNFNCNYCFEGVDKKECSMDELTQDGIVTWIDRNCKKLKNLNVTWFGGEPTLGMDIIESLSKKLIALCEKKRIHYSAAIVSNGSLLTQENVRKLSYYCVKSIQITLDGPRVVHDRIRFFKNNHAGSFDVIMENVRNYQKTSPIHTVFRVNVDSRNEDLCYHLIDDVAECLEGVPYVSMYFAPIHASTTMCKHISAFTLEALHYAEQETKFLEYAAKKNLCRIGLPPHLMGLCGAAKENALVVCPNGDVHKCWETVSVSKYKVGNINDEKFNLKQSSRDWTSWNPFKEEECLNCPLLPNCMGMCTYRFLYKENYSGNSALTKCPSLRFDFENRIRLYLKHNHR